MVTSKINRMKMTGFTIKQPDESEALCDINCRQVLVQGSIFPARTAESFLITERNTLSAVFPGKLGFMVSSESPESKFLSIPESGQCPKSGKEFSFPERHFLSGKIRGKIGVAIRTVRKADSVLRAERKRLSGPFPDRFQLAVVAT